MLIIQSDNNTTSVDNNTTLLQWIDDLDQHSATAEDKDEVGKVQ